ncbi:type II toxin-antitoxin system PemI/MazE family antitoxin [Enterococcus xiangfangensis]|uniref:AbrB family transcriptional regulator n=1 Tax=Enterococcus xiangfangensis TaxID=1296537 RepID=A0ABU3F6X2_9ENTE|nr:AbrB family transcriptional regulator [Enterococcus xiangfangensis]MDT2758404.1 AbrB family transcriptional regulator [Enterococcus xiangfangensis]
MLTAKSRLQGSSVAITLPSDNGKKPTENQEYIVVYSNNGTITLVPKIEDPFSGGEEAEYYEKDEWDDLAPEGREIW